MKVEHTFYYYIVSNYHDIRQLCNLVPRQDTVDNASRRVEFPTAEE